MPEDTSPKGQGTEVKPDVPPEKKGQEVKTQEQVAEGLGFKAGVDEEGKPYTATEALAKSYQEVRKAYTQKSQEAAELSGMVETPAPTSEKEEVDFYTDPEKAAGKVAQQEYRKMRVQEQIAEKQQANPQEWAELQPYMDTAMRASPQLARRPNAVNLLYDKAKEMRDVHYQELRKRLIGDVSIETLKKVAAEEATTKTKENLAATIPSGESVPPEDAGKLREQKIAEARDKGDVDGVLNVMFKKPE